MPQIDGALQASGLQTDCFGRSLPVKPIEKKSGSNMLADTMTRGSTTTVQFGLLGRPKTGIVEKVTLPVDGENRSFYIYIPNRYWDNPDRPVVFLLHGATLWGKIMELFTAYKRLAEKKGFIVVYPNALNTEWNDGSGEGYTASHDVKDLKFLSKIKDVLVTKGTKANSKACFAVGFSRGGAMSVEASLKEPGLFGAITMVASGLYESHLELINSIKSWASKTHVLFIKGDDDSAYPDKGGKGKIMGLRGKKLNVGKVVPREDGLKALARLNGGFVGIRDLETYRRARTIAQHRQYETLNGAVIEEYEVDRGGHTWPELLIAVFGERVGLWLDGMRLPILRRQSALPTSELSWQFFEEVGGLGKTSK